MSFKAASFKPASFKPGSWSGLLAAPTLPPVAEPDEVLRDFGPWIPLSLPRRAELEGRHIGANWSTGEVFARVELSGVSRSHSLTAAHARASTALAAAHIGASHCSAVPPRLHAIRRRNERAAALFLTIIRSR